MEEEKTIVDLMKDIETAAIALECAIGDNMSELKDNIRSLANVVLNEAGGEIEASKDTYVDRLEESYE